MSKQVNLCSETLKQKIEWLLNGGYLTQIGGKGKFAYGLDLQTNMFYSINKRSANAKQPKRNIQDPHIPLEDIHFNMEILYK